MKSLPVGARHIAAFRQMQYAPNAFTGAAFHCYAGSVSEQQNFYNAYPNKVVNSFKCDNLLM